MDYPKLTYGSVCSGIETAFLALHPYGFSPIWFCENASFPSKLLKYHYPNVPNMGDMWKLADKLLGGEIEVPSVFMGGTPCNSFSTLGNRRGLQDSRGALSIEFVHIADVIDSIRQKKGEKGALILWENVEAVLSDKGKAFSVFLSDITGNKDAINVHKWPTAGIVCGSKRTAVWRVLDAANFALPQQRKRVFLLATSNIEYNIIDILFEHGEYLLKDKRQKRQYTSLISKKGRMHREVFSLETNCLYAAYGEKYNGNSANGGTLFISENGMLRRLTPRECERLMGIPIDYTLIPNVRGDIARYRSLGNAWAVNVVNWIGRRISQHISEATSIMRYLKADVESSNGCIYLLDGNIELTKGLYLNCSSKPYDYEYKTIFDVLEDDVSDTYYLTFNTCKGILRRKYEKGFSINHRLETIMKHFVNHFEGNGKDYDKAILQHLGFKIRYYRKSFRLTQNDLAEQIGLSRKYIGDVEKGRENITILNLSKIAEKLGVNISDLLS